MAFMQVKIAMMDTFVLTEWFKLPYIFIKTLCNRALLKIGLFSGAGNIYNPFAVKVMQSYFQPHIIHSFNFLLFFGKCGIAIAMLFLFVSLLTLTLNSYEKAFSYSYSP